MLVHVSLIFQLLPGFGVNDDSIEALCVETLNIGNRWSDQAIREIPLKPFSIKQEKQIANLLYPG